jgi:hypothetical protein
MPIRTLPGTDLAYALVVFDENGDERAEADGTLMSETIADRVADPARPVSDVFMIAHGWQGDVPAAIAQFDRWIGAMAKQESDQTAARDRPGGFSPLIVGLHWPSLPFGDEKMPASAPALLSAGGESASATDADDVDAWARRIADTPRARRAIQTVLDAARHEASAVAPSAALLDAYAVLFEESGLEARGSAAAPGADQDGFDPAAIIAQSKASGAAPQPPTQLLGIGDTLGGLVLSPLRQLSFWKMKDRARRFGETGGHGLVTALQEAAPEARIHLMGHSFGCIVVSAAVAGAPGDRSVRRPVDTLFLVQGALSLWAYTDDIPFQRGTAGYFRPLIEQKLVSGPLVTTRSTFDSAVGSFYPLGAGIARQRVLGDDLPEYGGVGTFGIQGVTGAGEDTMTDDRQRYDFATGRVYNIEASQVIRTGPWPSGAHSDIAHPAVAHAFWQAVLAGS